MKKGYFIYYYHQNKGVGKQYLEILKAQPKEGFSTKDEAELHLGSLMEKADSKWFSVTLHKLIIMESFFMSNG